MRVLMLSWALIGALAAGFPIATASVIERPPAAAPDRSLDLLRERVAGIARAGSARVGLAAIDLTTGKMVSVNGGERFPMASTVKVAIAAAFLHGVQTGRFGLDRSYAMPANERHTAARIGDMRAYRGSFSGARLIDMMLTRSDNSAADILLHTVGGTRAVGDWLEGAGVTGQRVDRSIAQLLGDRETRKRLRVGRGRHRHWITVSVPRAAPAGDTRDSSTPEAMAALLVKLRNGELLDAARTDYLFEVMARCRTGSRRIRGLLPQGTLVAHKTGTLDGVTDDVGIVSLPDGHALAIAVFEQGRGGRGAHDRSIARLSRALYDGFGGLYQTASAMH